MESKVIKVFVSSTFKDLHIYRSYLVEHVYPKIERLCLERDIEFSYVDFRWGIPHSNINDIVKMCLAQIGKCQPYFIGIIGDRYGTVLPPDEAEILKDDFPEVYNEINKAKGISITEMEFVEGLLKNRSINPQAYCYKIADGKQAVMFDPADSGTDVANMKRRDFIKKIQEKGYILKEFSTPEELGKLIYEDFKTYINSIDKDAGVRIISQSKKNQKRIINSKTKCYLAEWGIQKELDNYLNFQRKDISKPLLIYGHSGSGKSSLIAWNSERLENKGYFVITHFVGFDGTLSEKSVVERLLADIREMSEQPLVEQEAFKAMIWWMRNTTEKVIFLIDGVNNIATNIADLKFEWIPYDLPENIRIVFTSTDEESLKTLAKSCDWTMLQLPPFEKNKSRQLVQSYLSKVYNKELNDIEKESFIEENWKANYSNPLYITTVMEELVRVVNFIDVGKKEVNLKEGISEIIPVKTDISDIVRFYMGFDSRERLFEMVLIRMEHSYSRRKDILLAVLSALAASKSGLTGEQIIKTTGLYGDIGVRYKDFSAFVDILLEELDFYIVKRGDKYTLFHGSFEEALNKRYHSTIENMRKVLVGYFGSLPNKVEDCSELYFQLYKLKDWESISNNMKSFNGCSEFIFGVGISDQARIMEGAQIFHNVSRVMLRHISDHRLTEIDSIFVLRVIKLLFEIGDEKGALQAVDSVVLRLEQIKPPEVELREIFDRTMSYCLQRDKLKAFYYLEKYMKAVDKLYGDMEAKFPEFYKYYADICLKIMEGYTLMDGNGNLKWSLAILLVELPRIFYAISLTWLEYRLFRKKLLKDASAISCREMFPSEVGEELKNESEDVKMLYNRVIQHASEDGFIQNLKFESRLKIAVVNLIYFGDMEKSINSMIESYEDCKQSRAFYSLEFAQVCKKIGQYYLFNTRNDKVYADLGFDYLHKAIVIFSKMKGIMSREMIECLEVILVTFMAWSSIESKALMQLEFNVIYIHDFYKKICDMSGARKKRFPMTAIDIALSTRYTNKFLGLEEICRHLESFSILNREVLNEKGRKKLSFIKWRKLSGALTVLLPIIYVVSIKIGIVSKNILTSKPISVDINTASTTEVLALTKGNLLGAAWNSENCFFTPYYGDNGIYRYNWLVDKDYKLYDGKAVEPYLKDGKNIYFLDENRELRVLGAKGHQVVIKEPIYKYFINGDKIYYIPYNEDIAREESFEYCPGLSYKDNHAPDYIYEYDLKKNSSQKITLVKASSFNIFNDKLYYISDASIFVKDLKTGQLVHLVKGDVYPKGLYITDEYIIYFNSKKLLSVYGIKRKESASLPELKSKIISLAAFNNCVMKRFGDRIYFYPFNTVNSIDISADDIKAFAKTQKRIIPDVEFNTITMRFESSINLKLLESGNPVAFNYDYYIDLKRLQYSNIFDSSISDFNEKKEIVNATTREDQLYQDLYFEKIKEKK